jgi:hypothetical protein
MTLAPFDWSRITWGRPDSPSTVLCSYCSASLKEKDEPHLMMWTGDGHAAQFCPACSELAVSASLELRYKGMPSGNGP